MKPESTLVRLSRKGRRVRMTVDSEHLSSLHEPATWSYRQGGVTSNYLRLLFNGHSPSLKDFRQLFAWVQNRVSPPPDVPEILERLQLTDEFGQLCQEQPLETLQMFATLNESPITAETVFDFD